jgi:hypothetical protein
MTKYLLLVVALAGLVSVAVSAPKKDEKPAEKAAAKPAEAVANDVHEFMQLKLNHSQKVLEGIALEDYEAISKHSQAISLLSQEASWQVLQTPDYLQHSAEFRRAADALTAAAKKKNLDGAALAYVDLTMKCVNCHKYVRGVRIAKLDR